MNKRAQSIISRIYDSVESMLWAGLVAFVIYFVAFIAPQIPKNQAIQSMLRQEAIASEQDAFCEKWGKLAGTREHSLCVLDLQAYRARIVDEYRDDKLF